MRRLDVDTFFGRGINPSSPVFAAREYERVDCVIIYHADLKIGVDWRN
jgi:hypothetical protein